MGEYDVLVKKGLKLKGAKVQKSKKKKSATDASAAKKSPEPAPAGESKQERQQTEAERKFEEHQRKMMEKMLAKEMSYAEKKKAYNKHLESLTDHNDMPKIGPG